MTVKKRVDSKKAKFIQQNKQKKDMANKRRKNNQGTDSVNKWERKLYTPNN